MGLLDHMPYQKTYYYNSAIAIKWLLMVTCYTHRTVNYSTLNRETPCVRMGLTQKLTAGKCAETERLLSPWSSMRCLYPGLRSNNSYENQKWCLTPQKLYLLEKNKNDTHKPTEVWQLTYEPKFKSDKMSARERGHKPEVSLLIKKLFLVNTC